jgi:hypothetical protein
METQNNEQETEPVKRTEFEARLETSPNIGTLAGALAKAQGEFGPVSKDRTVEVRTKDGGKYTFSYATLDSVLSATRPALAKHGLALFSTIVAGRIRTLLVHESGEWMASIIGLGETQRLQELGSEITYLRRYCVSAMLGVAADEDDDGNSASGNDWQARDRQGRGQPQRQEQRPAASKPAAAQTAAQELDPVRLMEMTRILVALRVGIAEADAAGAKGTQRTARINASRILWLARFLQREVQVDRDGAPVVTPEELERAIRFGQEQLDAGGKEAS